MNNIKLEKVTFLPKALEPDILYVSEEYGVAGHLCACGCGSKVITPLGPTEWRFSERQGLATLRPSVGNWQLACRSHYVITDGRIHWHGQWSEAEILAGRQAEQIRREAHYGALQPTGFWTRAWAAIKNFLRI